MRRQLESRLAAVTAGTLLLALIVAPMNACREQDLLAPSTPRRAIPKPNRTLVGSLGVGSPVDMDTVGVVAGSIPYDTQSHAALSINGTAYDLGTIQKSDTSSTYPTGMNNSGQVVGVEYDGSASGYGFLWTPDSPNTGTGTMQRVDGPNGPAQPLDINDAGQVVAGKFGSSGIVLWTASSAIELPNTTGGAIYPTSINQYGQIAGTMYDANGAAHGFLWTPAQRNGSSGTYALLDAPGAGGTTTASMNDFGQVLANGADGSTGLWTPSSPNGTSGSFVVLSEPFGPLAAVDINSRGDVLASGSGPYNNDCGFTSHLYLWRPTSPNGSAGDLADVSPEIGVSGGWFPPACSATGTFMSEEENATIQAFGQEDGADMMWTLGGLDVPPLAATITWTGTPNEGYGLSFDGGLNNIYSIGWSYHWDFGDGATATDRFATHAYADNGQYTVRLTVSDASGASNTVSTAIAVNNLPPTGTFNVTPQNPGEGSTYVLSVSGVSDAPADLPTLQLALDCGDGVGYRSVAISGSLSCSAPNEIVRTARAQLRDKDGAVSEYTSSVNVVDVAPTVSIVSAPTTVTDQTTYTISFKFTDPGLLDTWSYSINWGDGTTTGPVAVSAQGGTISASHRYAVNKKGGAKSTTYGISVNVTDNGGATGTTFASVLVTTNGYRP